MTNINIRVDEALKSQAESVLDDIGLNMTTAMTAFLKQVVRTGGIPFPLVADPYEKYLREADEEAMRTNQRYTHEEIMNMARGRIDELSR